MKPISELKKHNMIRVLLVDKYECFVFGFLKDGMIQVEGKWHKPDLFTEWMSISDLKVAIDVFCVNKDNKSIKIDNTDKKL
jgi:hypothetical protein